MANESIAYLKVKEIHKINGEFEQVDTVNKAHIREFGKPINIIDLHSQENNE